LRSRADSQAKSKSTISWSSATLRTARKIHTSNGTSDSIFTISLAIPGFVAAQFFKLSDTQYAGAQQQHYLMVWEIETDDLPRVFADVKARLKDGRTVFTDAFVGGFSTTMSPITKSVTAEEIEGKGIDEVEAIANGK
jgi:hypothetical protein